MRRLGYLLLLVLVVGASARCVNASTDCERWFAEYHKQLVHSQQLHRIAAAKRRAKAYARRKLAGYIKPAPAKPKPHLVSGIPMTRRQTLRHLDLACGVLPESDTVAPLIAEETPADLPPDTLSDEVSAMPGFDGPGTLLPEDTPPPPTFASAPPSAPGGGGPPVFTPPYTTPTGGAVPPSTPPGGGPPVVTPPSTPPGGGPPVVTPPYTPPYEGPPPATPPAVPEPSSFILLLTGAAGATGIIRRRFKR